MLGIFCGRVATSGVRAVRDTKIVTAALEGLSGAGAKFGNAFVGWAKGFGRGGASSATNSARLSHELAAKEISGGHAFTKHVVERGEFPGVRTRAEFSDVVEGTML